MGLKKVVKATVKRVRTGKNKVGSEYTRYFRDEAQRAKVMESRPAIKIEVKRVRDRKKNPVGSKYTRYFDDLGDMAKVMSGYVRYYGPEAGKMIGGGLMTAGGTAGWAASLFLAGNKSQVGAAVLKKLLGMSISSRAIEKGVNLFEAGKNGIQVKKSIMDNLKKNLKAKGYNSIYDYAKKHDLK